MLRALLTLLTISSVTVTVTVTVAAPPPKGAEGDAKKLDGTWAMVSGERDGKPIKGFDGGKLIVADGAIAVEADGKVVAKGTFQLDADKKVKEIDWEMTEGRDKGATRKACTPSTATT